MKLLIESLSNAASHGTAIRMQEKLPAVLSRLDACAAGNPASAAAAETAKPQAAIEATPAPAPASEPAPAAPKAEVAAPTLETKSEEAPAATAARGPTR
jgi:hypothetical protein